MPPEFLFDLESQRMNSFAVFVVSAAATACAQMDEAVNPGQSEQTAFPLENILTMWGLRGFDDEVTTSVSCDCSVTLPGFCA